MVNLGMIGAMVLPNVGGWLGSLITIKNVPTWYEGLNKPEWRPPNKAFGPVWTALYTGMGYASYLVYRDGGGFDGVARGPLILFGSQLALNWAWTPIFFGFHKLGLSLAEIILLYGNVVACTIGFWNVNRTAGLIMLPYLGWLSIATALTYCIWRDNPGPKAVKSK
jgi:benzodiazapine receptor